MTELKKTREKISLMFYGKLARDRSFPSKYKRWEKIPPRKIMKLKKKFLFEKNINEVFSVFEKKI